MKIGTVVRYVVDSMIVFEGRIEYVDGDWVGIRQMDGRLDEVLSSHVE